MSNSKLLERFFADTIHIDVVFLVEGEEIPGHRAAFALSCPYFDKLLNGDSKQSKSVKVEITGTSAKVFKEVKRYIYLGQLEVTDWKIEDLLGLLAVAHEFQYQELFTEVMTALEVQKLNFDSWTMLNSAAANYGSASLKAKCVSFAEAAVDKFLCPKNMEKFTEELICVMFETSKIRAVNQDKLLCGILQWKRIHRTARIQPVLQKIRWHEVSQKTLAVFAKLLIVNLTNEDEVLLCNELVDVIQAQSHYIAKVDNVLLLRNKTVHLELEQQDCILVCDNHSGYIEFRFMNTDSCKQIPVNRIEFELSYQYRIQEVVGRGIRKHSKKMNCEIVTEINNWIKYSATFSKAEPTSLFCIYSDKFDEAFEIALRNLVIY